MMSKNPAVYILASRKNSTLYRWRDRRSDQTNLEHNWEHNWEHKQELTEGFTKKYGIHDLVYYEIDAEILEAIRREKQIKKWNRAWKIRLIEERNPEWRDLWSEIAG